MLTAACTSAPEAASPTQSAASASSPPAGSAPAASQAAVTYYDETTSQIEVAVGARFTLALKANVTTPYKWSVTAAVDATALALVEERYVERAPAECSGCVGVGGRRLLTFEARRPGSFPLDLEYRSIGDPNEPPAASVHVTVTVKSPS